MAIYAMKYEITQGQYKDFLNTLTRAQQNRRVESDVSGDAPGAGKIYVMSATTTITNRNIISCPASGNGTTAPITFSTTVSSVDKGDRAGNYLSWMDLMAFADWAALRPMTELEFEKMGRGPLYPVVQEYAWGTTSMNAATTISGTEDGTETITTANANTNYNNTTFTGGDGGTGPLRAGIFATSSTVTREAAGASYYGVMELSGNVWEEVVTMGNKTGLSFSGTHGDGVLTTLTSFEGNATNLDWPGISGTISQGINGATGTGLRGGSWLVTVVNGAQQAVSNRTYAALTSAGRVSDYGGRCVRTAPQ
jgi:formylglycine-generating enzyme required for sulfatase activity